MKRFYALMVSVVVAAVGFTGCSKVPQAEIDAAKTAIEAAKKAEANLYSAEKFNQAENTLNTAVAEIEKQKSAFALTRNYDEALKQLQAATAGANEAAAAAAGEKEKVKAQVEAAQVEAQGALQQARDLLQKAPKGKEGKEALVAISNDLATVESALAETAASAGNGDYIGARDKLTASKEKIAAITEELNNAIAKVKK